MAALMLVGTVACTSEPNGTAASAIEAPSALPAGTHIGPVELLVNDPETVAAFYRDAVGLTVLGETGEAIVLGFDGPLIRLVKTDDAPDDQTQAGLYHSAILFRDETSLANTLAQISATAPESFVGASDHAVSQAFYFTDPEGNGVELYVDRPASEWQWNDGQVEMGNAYVDPNTFIREHSGEDAEPGEITMGHAHMRVGDLEEARRFYVDGLGFAQTSAGDGAAFFSANGYHHHIGVNTWTSAGAGERPALAGLGSLTIFVPDAGALDGVESRLTEAGFEPRREGQFLTVDDPWGIRISVRVTGSAPD